jgi:hypothetical protein
VLNECHFSPCRRYRYYLQCRLNNRWPGETVVFVGLNPSTADELVCDPTLNRVRSFSLSWGYSTVVLVNLFAYRSPNPEVLRRVRDPIGPENDFWIRNVALRSRGLLIAAWGGGGEYQGRAAAILQIFQKREVYCLGQTQNGSPKHPLYLPARSKPVPLKS